MFTNCLTHDDLPQIIPIFPLDNTLLLPNGLLPLNVFEERYLRMVKDAMATNRFIGIIQPDHKARANGNCDAIVTTGCAGRITQFQETEDNRYLITLKGLIRFEVIEEVESILPYRQIKPDWDIYADDIVEDCDGLVIDREKFFPLLKDFFNMYDLSCDWDQIEDAPCETLVTTLPMVLPFEPQEKQMVLEAKSLDKRFEILSSLMQMSVKSDPNSNNIAH